MTNPGHQHPGGNQPEKDPVSGLVWGVIVLLSLAAAAAVAAILNR